MSGQRVEWVGRRYRGWMPETTRRVFAALRIAVGLLVLAALITQITDDIAHSAFIAQNSFSYFTIESSLMNVVVLVVGSAVTLRMKRDTELLASVRLSILSYAIVTGAVYNLLLRGLARGDGYEAPRWCNEVMHVWVPIFIVLDWLLVPGAARIGWRRLWLVVSYPLAWLGFTMVRGAMTGWYPYPFLEPRGASGLFSVIVYIVLIAAFILATATAAIGLTRMEEHRLQRRAMTKTVQADPPTA